MLYKYPQSALLAMDQERKWSYTEKEKKFWPRWDSNPRPLEQITVALPVELQGQMGAGRGKLRW